MNADEDKPQFANTFSAIPETVGEAIEQALRASTLTSLGRVCAIVWETLEHAIFNQIRTSVLEKLIDKHVQM